MVPEGSRPEVLSSWKEIAEYLGIAVRTAQMWERERGLPIRRLPGARGPVSVEVAALEAWRYSRRAESPPSVPEDPIAGLPSASVPRPWYVRPWTCGPGLGVLLVGIALLGLWPRHLVPASVRAQGNMLVALDVDARECWRLTFPALSADAGAGSAWIGDLDGDGQHEVLYPYYSGVPASGTSLLCIGADGRERWRFTPGRAVRTADGTFGPPFDVKRFLVGRFGRAGEQRVMVSSAHTVYYPTQLALLDDHGRLLREYWHPGHLPALATTTIDGILFVVAGGVNNARKQATMILLDPDNFSGASHEEQPAYAIQGYGPGRERARIFFPRSCINEQLEPFAFVASIRERPDYLTADIQHHQRGSDATIFYDLNPDLTLRGMIIGSSFAFTHEQLHKNRTINHPLSEAESNNLRTITRDP